MPSWPYRSLTRRRWVDQLVACGIRAILNYAPIIPHVREGVKIRNIDPVLSLQSMTYYINSPNED